MAQTIRITDLIDPKKFDQHKEVLANYFEKGGTWKDLLQYDDNVLQTQYAKGYDYYQKGSFKEAGAVFSYLTMLDPYSYTFWMGLGMAKQSERLFEEAIVSYTAAEAMDPENPLPHLHLAQCFYALALREPAVKHLEQAVAIAGDRPEHQETKLKAATILKHLPK